MKNAILAHNLNNDLTLDRNNIPRSKIYHYANVTE